jgi:hypothetical protein
MVQRLRAHDASFSVLAQLLEALCLLSIEKAPVIFRL